MNAGPMSLPPHVTLVHHLQLQSLLLDRPSMSALCCSTAVPSQRSRWEDVSNDVLFRRRLLRVAMLVATEGHRISFARARCRCTHTCLKLFASSRRHDSALGSMVSDLEPEMRHTLHEKWKRQQVTRSSSTQENLSTIGFVSPLLIAGAALRLCRQPASLVAPHRQSMRTASTGGSCVEGRSRGSFGLLAREQTRRGRIGMGWVFELRALLHN